MPAQGTLMAWLSDSAFSFMVSEAKATAPLETGGVLLGYWVTRHEVVITRCIGPGPNAVHRRSSYRPDYDYQEAEIERVFRETEGAHVYLGDWHTHPGAKTAHLSWKDRATIRRIAESPDAQAPTPLMLVLCGDDVDWAPYAWIGRLQVTWRVWRHVYLSRAELRLYRGE